MYVFVENLSSIVNTPSYLKLCLCLPPWIIIQHPSKGKSSLTGKTSLFKEEQLPLAFEPTAIRKEGMDDGWMTSDFTSFSTVFRSYQDDERMIMKGCVQWNSIYG